jgi:hypothetical protein
MCGHSKQRQRRGSSPWIEISIQESRNPQQTAVMSAIAAVFFLPSKAPIKNLSAAASYSESR